MYIVMLSCDEFALGGPAFISEHMQAAKTQEEVQPPAELKAADEGRQTGRGGTEGSGGEKGNTSEQ